jgi:hypothetical protein
MLRCGSSGFAEYARAHEPSGLLEVWFCSCRVVAVDSVHSLARATHVSAAGEFQLDLRVSSRRSLDSAAPVMPTIRTSWSGRWETSDPHPGPPSSLVQLRSAVWTGVTCDTWVPTPRSVARRCRRYKIAFGKHRPRSYRAAEPEREPDMAKQRRAVFLVIDTCVWLDLAKDYSQKPLLAALEELVRMGFVHLILPQIVRDEFVRNRERIIEESGRGIAGALRRAKELVAKFAEDPHIVPS